MKLERPLLSEYYSDGTFDHNWFDEVELIQHNTENGRYYTDDCDNRYKSVTTFLSQFSKDKIDEWKRAIGEEEALKISKRASTRGSFLHENIENYLLNHRIYIPKVDLIGNSLFKSIEANLHNISNIVLLESPIYSRRMKLAGTVDCVANWNGVPSIIDFKSSTNIKDRNQIDSYFLQTTIYSLMVSELYSVDYKQLVILIANEFSKPTVYIDQRKKWIPKLVELLKFDNR